MATRGKYLQGDRYESARKALDVWASVIKARSENAGCPTLGAIFGDTSRWVVAWKNTKTGEIKITGDYKQNFGEGWVKSWDARVVWPNTTNVIDHDVIHLSATVDSILRKDPDHQFMMSCLLTHYPRSGTYEAKKLQRGQRAEATIRSMTDRAIKLVHKKC